MSEYLPNIVKEINKKAKATKITTLSKARSFDIVRFFSGSFGIDSISGGGFAFRRILLLYGAKSSGKNSHLYQMMAYNQRICRHCGGILPNYITTEPSTNFVVGADRWADVLLFYLRLPHCTCTNPIPRIFLVLDYEKSLGSEQKKKTVIRFITNKKSGEAIDEMEYDEKVLALEDLTKKDILEDSDKEHIKILEKFVKDVDVKEEEIERLNMSDYLESCGVLTDQLLVADPADTDEGVDLVKDFVRSREVDSVIWDSLQAAIPRYVKDREADEATMGVEAKMNGLLMRQICAAFSAQDITNPEEAKMPSVIITSQVRDKLGFMSGPASFSGGHAIAHHISLALEFKREHFLKEDGAESKTYKDDYFGQHVRIRAEKSKIGVPGDYISYNYYFKRGEYFPIGYIDHVDEIATLAIKKNLIERAGPYYRVLGEQFQGKALLNNYLRENKEFLGTLYQKILGNDEEK